MKPYGIVLHPSTSHLYGVGCPMGCRSIYPWDGIFWEAIVWNVVLGELVLRHLW